jgi:hypothetical protein
MAKEKEEKLLPHELPYMRDGREEMKRNPNPIKYFVIRMRKDNSVKYVTKDGNDNKLLDYRDQANLKSKSTVYYTAEWYKDDETAEEKLGYKFTSDEVDKKTN